MATIANLMVKLGIEGINKTQRALKKFSSSAVSAVKKITGALKTVGKVAAGALAGMAVSFGLMAKSAVAANKEVVAWAQSLDISIGTLQRWNYAASSVGFEGDKIADIFKDINDKLGDFILTGGGEAANILEKFGISAKEISGLKAPDALFKIWDTIKNIGRQEQIFVLEAIGNDASKLIPLLEKGRSKLKGLFSEYDKSGAALSEKQSKALETVSNALRQASSLWKAFTSQLTAAVAPAITALVEKTKAWITSSGGIKNIATKAIEKFTKALEGAVSLFTYINIGSKMAVAGIKLIGLSLVQVFNEGMVRATEFFGYVISQYTRMKDTSLNFFEERRERQIQESIDKFGKGVLSDSDRKFYEGRQVAKDSTNKGKNSAQLCQDAAAPFRQAAKDYKDNSDKLSISMRKLEEQLKKQVLAAQNTGKNIAAPIQEFRRNIRKNTGVPEESTNNRVAQVLQRNGNSFSYGYKGEAARQAAGSESKDVNVVVTVKTNTDILSADVTSSPGFASKVTGLVEKEVSNAARQVNR